MGHNYDSLQKALLSLPRHDVLIARGEPKEMGTEGNRIRHYLQDGVVINKDDTQSLCGHEYFSRRHSKNFSTPPHSFFLLEKHSSGRHIGTYAKQLAY